MKRQAGLPDEREGKNSRQSDGELQMSPVTDEVRQQSEKHPRRCPEQLQYGTRIRAVYCWEQLARHSIPGKHRTLNTRNTRLT